MLTSGTVVYDYLTLLVFFMFDVLFQHVQSDCVNCAIACSWHFNQYFRPYCTAKHCVLSQLHMIARNLSAAENMIQAILINYFFFFCWIRHCYYLRMYFTPRFLTTVMCILLINEIVFI